MNNNKMMMESPMMKTLGVKACLTVPSKDKNGNRIPERANRVIEFTKEMASTFGGVTENEGFGSWVNSSNELMIENVSLLTSFTDKPESEVIEAVSKIAYKLKADTYQEAVIFEVNGKGYIV